MKKALIIASLFFSQAVLAESTTYNVEGMHCGSCVKAIKAQVCKMDGLESCDVSLGKVIVAPKAGVTITQDQIQAAISKAGEYKVNGTSKSK
jgi:copper chaperone CopZ